MCGINCFISKKQKKINRKLIENMNKQLKHRGPDDSGYFIYNNIGLGHTRLSILDLSSHGHQPMEFDNLIIVFNGEIFNYIELRDELKKIGYNFVSNSDTEVILKLFHYYGEDFIKKLNGMFALAIYDKQSNEVYLYRDRYGIKPMYIYEDNKKIIFSSEIKPILSNNNISIKINTNKVQEYFQLLYTRSEETLFDSIKKVKPGTCLKICLYNFKIQEKIYYHLPNDKNNLLKDESEVIKNLDNLLNDSIEKRMRSDIDVGSFLSGGVDSSLTTAIASEKTNKQLQTFSITFKGLNDFFDESKYAEAVSKKYNTEHHFLKIDFNEVFESMEEIIYKMEEPNADTSIFLNYFLSKLTKQYVSVTLSGLGGDELFGGYNRHQAFMIINYLKSIPGIKILKKLEFIGSSRTNKLLNYVRHFSKLLDSIEKDPSKVYEKIISYENILDLKLDITSFDLNEALRYDIKDYMNNNLLNFTDKMSMSHSLEIRVPFLDYRIVDFSFMIDTSLKISFFNKKIILKKLALNYLDKDIVYRRKQGFAAPIEIWLKMQGIDKIKNLIDINLISKYINKNIIYNNLELFFKKNIDKSLQIYSYIVFSLWYKNFKRHIDE